MSKQPGIPFFKLHGAGNDVLVVHGRDLPRSGKPAFIRRLAHRKLGVGSDQVVEVLSLKPLAIQIWNCDGSKAEMCANGSRSFLLFLAERQGWVKRGEKPVPIQISGKPFAGLPIKGGYELCLGQPDIKGKDILPLGERQIPFWEVHTGNPHAVLLLGKGEHAWAQPGDFSSRELGPQIETHARFPKKTNVEFVHPWAQKGQTVEARVEVWERGAGPTLSCGTGAVAVAAVLRELTGASRFRLRMTDFWLSVRFDEGRAFLSGPCSLTAEGRYFT